MYRTVIIKSVTSVLVSRIVVRSDRGIICAISITYIARCRQYSSKLREVPGTGDIGDDLHADDFTTLDLTISHQTTSALTLQVMMLNALDKAAIVSHRPFGARPNRPRSLVARIKYQF